MRLNLKKINITILLFFIIGLYMTILADDISNNDSDAFITKVEFDSIRNNLQHKIDYYSENIDDIIDDTISEYIIDAISPSDKDGNYIHSFLDVETEIVNKEDISNKVSIITSASNDTQYPSAKAAYDAIEKKQDNIVAERGLSFGTGVDAKKIGHSNNISAQTTKKFGEIKFDSEGHITGFVEKHLYLHTLRYQSATGTENNGTSITIINDSSEPITHAKLKSWLQNNGYVSYQQIYSNLTGIATWRTVYGASSSGGDITTSVIMKYIDAGVFYNAGDDSIKLMIYSPDSGGSLHYTIYPNTATSGWVLREDLEMIQQIY